MSDRYPDTLAGAEERYGMAQFDRYDNVMVRAQDANDLLGELLEALQKIAGGHGIPDDTLATGGLYGWAQGVAREAIAKVEKRDNERIRKEGP